MSRKFKGDRLVVASHNPGKLREFYLRLRVRKGHKIAIVTTERKLLVAIYWMLKRGEPFKEENKKLTERKQKELGKTAKEYELLDEIEMVLEINRLMKNDEVPI